MKQKEKKPSRLYFDETVKYLCPMIPIGKDGKIENLEKVVCSLRNVGKYDVQMVCDGYKNATFFDTYFEWLLWTGYVKKVEKK